MMNDPLKENAEGHTFLTDLHSHLLPGIDDGAKDASESVKLLKLEYDSGVRQIALTSHFDCEKISLSDFLVSRRASCLQMQQAVADSGYEWSGLTLKTGAEVFFSPNLCSVEPEELCIQGTPFLLLELPTEMMPAYFSETIYRLQACGITPVIAHVERYFYVMNDLPILCDWIDQGMYIQINAGTILNGGSLAKLCLKLIKWNMCHVLASDVHSVNRRPPDLSEGLHAVSARLGQSAADRLLHNADLMFNGREPIIKEMHYPRKFLKRWR